MSIRRRYIAISALAIPALLGCSGAEPVTPSQWLAKADAVCRDSQAEIEELGEPTSIDEIRIVAGQRAEIRTTEVERLEALDAPDELAATIDALLDELRAANKTLVDAAATTTLPSTVRAIEAARDAIVEARSQAADLGLLDCGLDPSDLDTDEFLVDVDEVKALLITSLSDDDRLNEEEVECIADFVLAAVPPELLAEQALDGSELDEQTRTAISDAIGECVSADRLLELES